MSVSVLVPALTLLGGNGVIERKACANYALAAAQTWVDRFILAGSLGLGFALSRAQRREVLELWLERVAPSRLIACTWDAYEAEQVDRLGVRPMAVIQDADNEEGVLRFFEGLPQGSYVYSHPQYTRATLSPAVVDRARALGTLPAGAKVSKVELKTVRELRDAAGPNFDLYDGRCRHVRASMNAGATGVVAVPLSTLPSDLPPRDDVDALQAVIDRGQQVVDALPSVVDQAVALRAILAL